MLFLIKYNFLGIIKNRSAIFWLLIFPFALGGIFKLVIPDGGNTVFKAIPIAVSNKATAEIYDKIKLNDKVLFLVKQIENKDKALGDSSIIAYIDYNPINSSKAPKIYFNTEDENTVNRKIVEDTTDTIYRNSFIITSIIKEKVKENILNSKKIYNNDIKNLANNIAENLNKSYIKKADVLKNKQEKDIYFYALITMICMGCSSYGVVISDYLRKNDDISKLSHVARILIAPVSRLKQIIALLITYYAVATLNTALLYFYLRYILKIDFGGSGLQIFITLIIGSLLGILLGLFNGLLTNKGNDEMQGINAGIYVVLGGALTGMMASKVPSLINSYLPIINYINPGNVIQRMFFSLYIGDYNVFYRAMINALILGGIFLMLIIILLRRKLWK